MTDRNLGLIALMCGRLRWARLKLWWGTRRARAAYSRMFDGRKRGMRDGDVPRRMKGTQ
jgi:hypothetical protein